jgi:hypothetical protein
MRRPHAGPMHALLLALLLWPGAVLAQAPDPVAGQLEALGMRVTTLATDPAPVLQARFEGGSFYVAQCAPSPCSVLYASFRPARPIVLAAVRAWNTAHPEGIASIDKAGHPALERTLRGREVQDETAFANATRAWLRDFVAFRNFVFAGP